MSNSMDWYWCGGCGKWHPTEMTNGGVHHDMANLEMEEPDEQNFEGTAKELLRFQVHRRLAAARQQYSRARDVFNARRYRGVCWYTEDSPATVPGCFLVSSIFTAWEAEVITTALLANVEGAHQSRHYATGEGLNEAAKSPVIPRGVVSSTLDEAKATADYSNLEAMYRGEKDSGFLVGVTMPEGHILNVLGAFVERKIAESNAERFQRKVGKAFADYGDIALDVKLCLLVQSGAIKDDESFDAWFKYARIPESERVVLRTASRMFIEAKAKDAEHARLLPTKTFVVQVPTTFAGREYPTERVEGTWASCSAGELTINDSDNLATAIYAKGCWVSVRAEKAGDQDE